MYQIVEGVLVLGRSHAAMTKLSWLLDHDFDCIHHQNIACDLGTCQAIEVAGIGPLGYLLEAIKCPALVRKIVRYFMEQRPAAAVPEQRQVGRKWQHIQIGHYGVSRMHQAR